MTVFEIAEMLGKALKEDERLVALEEAKTAYEADAQLKTYMMEYDVQQKALQNEIAKPEKDSHLIDMIQNRIDELYHLIVGNAAFLRLNEAQQKVNDLMNEVNNVITFHITGEMPCTHDCASCGGSCHH